MSTSSYDRFKAVGKALKERDMQAVAQLTGNQKGRVRELLTMLKEGNTWLKRHPEEAKRLQNRAQPIINELSELGMHPDFSMMCLFMDTEVSDLLEGYEYPQPKIDR